MDQLTSAEEYELRPAEQDILVMDVSRLWHTVPSTPTMTGIMNIWSFGLNRSVCQNFLVPSESDVVVQQHGLGGLCSSQVGGDRVCPIAEKAPVDISCHIVVSVGDFCLEELLTSFYQVGHCFILLLAEAAQLAPVSHKFDWSRSTWGTYACWWNHDPCIGFLCNVLWWAASVMSGV
eukprot:2269717-Ditylum_brightwellii.AAC.2